MSRTAWLWVAVVIVLLAALFFWMTQPQSSTPTQTNTTTTTDQTPVQSASSTGTVSGTVAAPSNVSVTYDGNSFSPAQITVAKGGTVTFTDTAGSMWLASDPHPSHTAYDGTTRTQHCAPGYTGAKPFDQCASGSTFSFTFDKVGTWGYHDHMNDGAHGSVTVVAQ